MAARLLEAAAVAVVAGSRRGRAHRNAGDAVYLLGPIASAIAIYAVWRLGRAVATPAAALVAALALEGTHFFNFSAP